MTEPDQKADLHRYLQDAREALLWKLEGLSEYDLRVPRLASFIVAGCAASSPTAPARPWWPPTRP
jgi:hypothetical protein